MRVQASRELDAPIDDVWGFLAEPYHLPDWWPDISAVRPDRRGLAPGARWEIVGPTHPTLFRRANPVSLLLVREVAQPRRVSWHLTGSRLDVEVRLEPLEDDRTQVTLTIEGPWRPEVFGRPRALPGLALKRLHDLCQTAASL